MFRVVAIHHGQMTLDQPVHFPSPIQRFKILRLVKAGGRQLVIPSSGNGIVVHGQAVHEAPGDGHDLIRPFRVALVGAAGDAVQPVAAVVAAVGLIAAELVGVELRPHIAAAAPAFVAHAPVFHRPRLPLAVGPALPGHGGVAAAGQVFHPLAHFLHGAAAQIGVDVGLAAQLTAQLHKFVGAEGVVLHHAAPVGVDHALAVFLGADAVPPVIFVGEAAAGPAKHGDLYGPQRLHRVGAHPVDVADLAVLAHVQAVVDAPAQMLRKMPEKVPANGSLGLLGGYGQLCHGDSFLR